MHCVGGGDRTHDPRLMSPVLYRLSYPDIFDKKTLLACHVPSVAGDGIEPPSQGYEPCETPFLYPAIKLEYSLVVRAIILIKHKKGKKKGSCLDPLI